MSKSQMSLTEATQFLGECQRDMLKDDAFGDAEVFWRQGGKTVANGYFGKTNTIGIKETEQFAPTCFEGADAEKLENVGQQGKYWQNDAGDPNDDDLQSDYYEILYRR